MLEELVGEGYKGENGTFKSGTHEEVVRRMKNYIPEINLRATGRAAETPADAVREM